MTKQIATSDGLISFRPEDYFGHIADIEALTIDLTLRDFDTVNLFTQDPVRTIRLPYWSRDSFERAVQELAEQLRNA